MLAGQDGMKYKSWSTARSNGTGKQIGKPFSCSAVCIQPRRRLHGVQPSRLSPNDFTAPRFQLRQSSRTTPPTRWSFPDDPIYPTCAFVSASAEYGMRMEYTAGIVTSGSPSTETIPRSPLLSSPLSLSLSPHRVMTVWSSLRLTLGLA